MNAKQHMLLGLTKTITQVTRDEVSNIIILSDSTDSRYGWDCSTPQGMKYEDIIKVLEEMVGRYKELITIRVA
jgi:hypothetical protein